MIRKHTWRDFALLGFSIAVSAIVAVLVGRRVLPPSTSDWVQHLGDYDTTLADAFGRPLSKKMGFKLRFDPFVTVRNYPDQRTRRYTTDQYGFRGGIPRTEKPLAMIVGGSLAFGYGLDSDDDTLSANLNRLNNLPYRFVNAGVTGYLSGNELGLMVHYLDSFKPRLYIALDGWNDFFGQWGTKLSRLGYGFNRAYVYPLFDEIPMISQVPRDWGPQPSEHENLERIVRTYVDNLERMNDFARARGADFAVVLQPELGGKTRSPEEEFIWAKSSKSVFGDYSRAVKNYYVLVSRASAQLRAKGIPMLGLFDDPAIQKNSATLYLDLVHLNAPGQNAMASQIAAFIGRQRFRNESARNSNERR